MTETFFISPRRFPMLHFRFESRSGQGISFVVLSGNYSYLIQTVTMAARREHIQNRKVNIRFT